MNRNIEHSNGPDGMSQSRKDLQNLLSECRKVTDKRPDMDKVNNLRQNCFKWADILTCLTNE